jgi:hypothetical protein
MQFSVFIKEVNASVELLVEEPQYPEENRFTLLFQRNPQEEPRKLELSITEMNLLRQAIRMYTS